MKETFPRAIDRASVNSVCATMGLDMQAWRNVTIPMSHIENHFCKSKLCKCIQLKQIYSTFVIDDDAVKTVS